MALSNKNPGSQLPMPEAIVDQLLESLATDDLFRAQFEKDPRAALARLGYEAAPGETICLHTPKLADKQMIAATRDEMRNLLILGSLSQIPNRWDSAD
jgi:putative modified peptide